MRFQWLKNVLFFLSILGPGIITATVDNDAPGIATYSLAGAHFGYKLLWLLVPITVILIIIQEMSTRMAVVSGKGLADLIREAFGAKITFYVIIALLIANFGNVLAEFAGVAAGMELFGVSKYISLPVAGVLLWFLVVKGTYKNVERIFFFATFFYITYILSGFLAAPDLGTPLLSMLAPHIEASPAFIMMAIAIVGTTIAPWMQFYIQASVVEKGTKIENYGIVKADVVLGSIITAVIAFFIIVACAGTLFAYGIQISDAKDAALALRPFAGKWASLLFGFGLVNASLFAASILPLSTSYAVCEGLGFEAGVNKKLNEAPWFFGLYTVLIMLGIVIILIPGMPLLDILYFSQVANGFLLPVILILMLQLINKKWLMGKYVNSTWMNVVGWTTAAVLIAATAVLLGMIVFPEANAIVANLI